MLSSLDHRLAPAPAPARVAWLRGITYAHRGLHGQGRVENSWGAFTAAVDAGLGIECDVRESADGVAMVFHDHVLDRLTEESGLVIERTAEELQRVRFRATREAMPVLGEVIARCAGQVPILVEIKTERDRPIGRLCKAVAETLSWSEGPAAIMSFDPRVGHWFARHSPATVRGLVVTEQADRTRRAAFGRHVALWRARPDFLAYDVRDLPSRFAATQRARGLPLLTWTVADAALLARSAVYADAPIAEAEGLAAALAPH